VGLNMQYAHVSARRDKEPEALSRLVIGTDLGFAAPTAEIACFCVLNAAVERNAVSLADEHRACRDDVHDRRLARALEREPAVDGDVVSGAGVSDG
jgi:hypothetical protein